MRIYKWTDEDIIQFCEPLAELLGGGMTLLEALRFLSTQANSKTKKRIAIIMDCLKEGSTFSEALKHVDAPSLFVSIIVCSEQNNAFIYALRALCEHYGQRIEWRRKWQQITIYPVIILTTIFICLLFLLTVVLPHFKGMYESLDVAIPESLVFLISAGEWATQYGGYVFIFAVLIVLSFLLSYKHSDKFRINVIAFLLRVPIICSWLKLHYTHHAAFLMGFLLKSRLDILSVFTLLGEFSSSTIIKKQMVETKTLLVAGQSLSSIMRSKIYRDDFSRIIETGENAGRLPEMIETYATNLKNLSYRRITALTRVIQPALIVGIGAFLGVVIMMLFMPVFGIINEL